MRTPVEQIPDVVDMTRRRGWYRLRVVGINAGVLLVLLALVELGTLFLLHHPLWLGTGRLLYAARALYMENRAVVQYEAACATYDPDLTYRLRPGTCVFENLEFETALHVNAAGLRDDEQALDAPTIIVLGDSYAMGWGVEQDETFAQQMEAGLQVPVLNAGVSSYGTARELLLLRQLPTDSLHTLLLQYSDTDLPENQAFVAQDGLPTLSERRYQQVAATQQAKARYVFGKHLWTLSRLAASSLMRRYRERTTAQPAVHADHTQEAASFLAVLHHHADQLRGVRILVFETAARAQNDDLFIRALQDALDASPDVGLHIETVNVAPVLTSAHYFALDDHLNPTGHRVVADALLAHLRTTTP